MRAVNPNFSHQEVLELLQYDASTGMLYWRQSRGGTVAGGIASTPHRGHMRISIKGRRMGAHRLIWFYVYGTWPTQFVDHVDGNGLNNRIENLREATKQQNSQNRENGKNASGFRGVYKVSRKLNIKNKFNSDKRVFRPWCAKIMVDDVSIHLGNFLTKKEAMEARKVAEIKYYGEFSWNGDRS